MQDKDCCRSKCGHFWILPRHASRRICSTEQNTQRVQNSDPPISALGQKPTCATQLAMSAKGQKRTYYAPTTGLTATWRPKWDNSDQDWSPASTCQILQ